MDTRPLAVVTGASSGIGFELARRFAEEGFDLVVAAEDVAITTAAEELQGMGAAVEPVQADLTDPAAVERLASQLTGRPIDALALNAGVGLGGEFVEGDLARELGIIDLNVRSTVHLARLVLPAMVARGEGRVLITSSIASTMPGTYQAVYNASKAFLQSFAVAVRAELEDSGVTVTSLMPGPTETRFFTRAEMEDTKIGASDSKDDPAEVARMGFEAMMNGEERAVAESLSTKLQAAGSRFMPDRLKAAMHARMAEPGSAEK